MPDQVYIPAYIRVHLGKPDSDAETVTVPFLTYVKNVASSEIYPTWPENAIRANMFAQISFALNRIYTEHYRARGYDFDITSLSAHDQSYVHNRGIFGPMETIGNELFNDYIVRGDNVEPLLTTYCDGRETTCEGLSQWGTVDLANRGKTPFQMLQQYYGNDIRIIRNAPILDITESYPGYALKVGSTGDNVALIQNQLNYVNRSYSTVPKILAVDGVFAKDTEDAVKEFQKIFELPVDGIVGKGTWYKLLYIYNAVRKLATLQSDGEKMKDAPRDFQRTLRLGDSGKDVNIAQFYINNVAGYNRSVPSVSITGTYGPETVAAVKEFQKSAGLPVNGELNRATFDKLYNEYRGTVLAQDAIFRQPTPKKYPGAPIRPGSTGEDVRVMQLYLLAVAKAQPDIPEVVAIGYFGDMTERAVRAFQKKHGLPQDGIVGPDTWNKLTAEYQKVRPSL